MKKQKKQTILTIILVIAIIALVAVIESQIFLQQNNSNNETKLPPIKRVCNSRIAYLSY